MRTLGILSNNPTPNAPSTTRLVYKDTTMVRSMRKYRRRVFFAMRLLFCDDSVDIIIDDRLLIADSAKHHAFALYSFIVLHKVDTMPKYRRQL